MLGSLLRAAVHDAGGTPLFYQQPVILTVTAGAVLAAVEVV